MQADPELTAITLDAHDQRLALDEVEAHVDVVGHPLLCVAVQEGLLDVGQATDQALLQHADAFAFGAHLLLRDAEGGAHADDLVRGQRARTHATLMPATVHLRLDPHARLAAHIERADALGPVGLVRGQAHQIDRQRGQVDRNLACGLRGVGVEDDPAFTAHRADGGDVLDDADLVVDQHHRDQDRVGTQCVAQAVQIQQAVLLHVEVGHLEALAFELAAGVEHRLVLGLHRDDVLAARLVEMGGALERQVVGLGRARGPDDFPRVRADQRSDILAGLLDDRLSFPAPTRGCATRDCRSAPAATAPSRRPRVGRPGWVAP